MMDATGKVIRLGDTVHVEGDVNGVVVGIIDDNIFDATLDGTYWKEKWTTGLLVRTNEVGLLLTYGAAATVLPAPL